MSGPNPILGMNEPTPEQRCQTRIYVALCILGGVLMIALMAGVSL